jgi:predicted esterase
MPDHGLSWSETDRAFSHRLPVFVRPGPEATSPLVLLCHGMGDSPRAWAARWPRVLALPAHVVAPAGPYPFEIRKETGIRIGYAWYLYDGDTEPFRSSVTLSSAWLADLVGALERERGWRPRHRALLGFSQGAYLGFVAALRRQDVFTELVAVGGRLKESFVGDELREGGPLRVLILHGRGDEAVSPAYATGSRDALRRAGYDVALEELAGPHRVEREADPRAALWLADAWGTGEAPPG